MKSGNLKRSLPAQHTGCIRWAALALLLCSVICVASLAAQTPSQPANAEPHSAATASPAPNYALEARFLPDSMNKLVFDLSVTPHWFTQSDKFWYAYRTTEGTKYYIVDPVKKTKSLLWDNAKVAAALSLLTNFPYDAQRLPVRRLKLVDNDAHMRFEVEIRKNAVVPNEPEKKIQDDGSQQGNESEIKQTQDKQTEQQGQRGDRSGQPPAPAD